MTRAALAALLLAPALAGCASAVAPLLKPHVTTETVRLKAGDWSLDPAHAALLFHINHLGFSDLVGRFETFDAVLTGDPSDPETLRVSATIDVASLDMANDAFAEELKSPDWFDAATYSQASFRTLSVIPETATTARIDGELTLHGITRPITLQAMFNGTGYDAIRGSDVAGFSATTTINRSDFGVSKYSGLITDDIRIEIQAEFLKQ